MKRTEKRKPSRKLPHHTPPRDLAAGGSPSVSDCLLLSVWTRPRLAPAVAAALVRAHGRAGSETSRHWLLKSNYTAWNSCLEKQAEFSDFPMVSIITQLYKLKGHLWLLYLTLHLEILLGEGKLLCFNVQTPYTTGCVWQSCHPRHSFLSCQLPFFPVSGESQSSMRKAVFGTSYRYLAYHLCLMKKGAIKIPSEQGATLDATARLRELRSTHGLPGTCLATPTGWSPSSCPQLQRWAPATSRARVRESQLCPERLGDDVGWRRRAPLRQGRSARWLLGWSCLSKSLESLLVWV